MLYSAKVRLRLLKRSQSLGIFMASSGGGGSVSSDGWLG